MSQKTEERVEREYRLQTQKIFEEKKVCATHKTQLRPCSVETFECWDILKKKVEKKIKKFSMFCWDI